MDFSCHPTNHEFGVDFAMDAYQEKVMHARYKSQIFLHYYNLRSCSHGWITMKSWISSTTTR
uniref:Uncharacterized protein n=1 Tax=Megaselia scalaris TaxID=36166 RepID=T1GSS4_MEGSC